MPFSCHLTDSAVSRVTLRRSLSSVPQTSCVVPSLDSSITHSGTGGASGAQRGKKNKKNWQINRFREVRENWELSEQAVWWRRANKLLQLDDHWFEKHGAELWHHASKQGCMIMTAAFLENVSVLIIHNPSSISYRNYIISLFGTCYVFFSLLTFRVPRKEKVWCLCRNVCFCFFVAREAVISCGSISATNDLNVHKTNSELLFVCRSTCESEQVLIHSRRTTFDRDIPPLVSSAQLSVMMPHEPVF